jgi:intracellular multiplication protein IcmD
MKVKAAKFSWLGVTKIFCLLLVIAACFYAGHAFAQDSADVGGDTSTIGGIASQITTSFKSIGQLMIAIAYLAGFGFVIGAIFKFKQHKDNPTQIPMGTPIAMLVIGIALIFLPSFIEPAQKTIFGTSGGTPGGFRGGGALSVPGAAK